METSSRNIASLKHCRSRFLRRTGLSSALGARPVAVVPPGAARHAARGPSDAIVARGRSSIPACHRCLFS